jgi:hypothetical protein
MRVRAFDSWAGLLCEALRRLAEQRSPCHIRPAAQVRGPNMRGRGAGVGQREEFLAIGGGGVK